MTVEKVKTVRASFWPPLQDLDYVSDFQFKSMEIDELVRRSASCRLRYMDTNY